jgi:hypothetical protein
MVEACTNGVGCLPDTKNTQAKEKHSSLFARTKKRFYEQTLYLNMTNGWRKLKKIYFFKIDTWFQTTSGKTSSVYFARALFSMKKVL